jgi:hypothetical protein
MGKKAKEHRAKVAKRNKKIAQERYSMQSKLTKMMEKMAEQQQAQELEIKVGDENVPFEVVGQPSSVGIKGFEFEGNVSFKEENSEILNVEEFEPEVDSAGFSVEDREEPKQENEQ